MLLRGYRKWPLPSLPFLLGIWPRGKCYLSQACRWPHQSVNHAAGGAGRRAGHDRNLYRFYRWTKLKYTKPAALTRLAGAAFSRRHQNSYHNGHHVMQVMLSAALLSIRAGCSASDRQMLILAAMAHDLGHQGARTRPQSATNEAAAAHKACQLFFRSGAQGAARRQFTALILATAPNMEFITCAEESPTPQPWQDLAMLLRDADLFASHNYRRKMQNWLAAKVKFELRLIQPVTDILSNFLATTRLQSRVAIDLAVRSKSSRYLFCGK